MAHSRKSPYPDRSASSYFRSLRDAGYSPEKAFELTTGRSAKSVFGRGGAGKSTRKSSRKKKGY